ncbi:hypothetical protein K5X82_09510 [Halosquirtibacter xylanolyticus]|uniref:glycosyl hydrolase family 18 protein n=1 Tax=Halosquirtibacter xylanolyticus TaxID=3374599 RepID=UPI003747EB83|nr:hypothetical protein K5X82_09510 [Prolixibacteraceae bacterium]
MKTLYTLLFLCLFTTYAFAQPGPSIRFKKVWGDRIDFKASEIKLPVGQQQFSFESWIYRDGTSANCRVINMGYSGKVDGNGFAILANQNMTNLTVVLGSMKVNSSIDALPADTWSHIALTFDGTIAEPSERICLYVNGVKTSFGYMIMSQNQQANVPTEFPSVGNIFSFAFGSFCGNIADTRMWNIALNSSEVNEWSGKYIDNKHPQFTHLIHNWKTDDKTSGVVTNLLDSSGDANGTPSSSNISFVEGKREAAALAFQTNTPIHFLKENAIWGGLKISLPYEARASVQSLSLSLEGTTDLSKVKDLTVWASISDKLDYQTPRKTLTPEEIITLARTQNFVMNLPVSKSDVSAFKLFLSYSLKADVGHSFTIDATINKVGVAIDGSIKQITVSNASPEGAIKLDFTPLVDLNLSKFNEHSFTNITYYRYNHHANGYQQYMNHTQQSHVAFFGVMFDDNLNIVDFPDANSAWPFVKEMNENHNAGTKNLLCLSGRINKSSASRKDFYNRFLKNPNMMNYAAEKIADYVDRFHLDGVNIDFELFYGTDLAEDSNYGAFVRAIRSSLDKRAKGYELSICLPVSASEFDVLKLSQAVDFIVVMSYDITQRHTSPLNTIQTRVNNFFLSQGVPKDKLVICYPLYGNIWKISGQGGATEGSSPVGTALVKNLDLYAADNHIVWHDPYKMNYYDYQNKGEWYRAYIDDAKSFEYKLGYVRDAGYQGFGFWSFGLDGEKSKEVQDVINKVYELKSTSNIDIKSSLPITIRENTILLHEPYSTLSLYDMMGHKVFTCSILSNQVTIPSNLNGIYVLVCKQDLNEVATKVFIK